MKKIIVMMALLTTALAQAGDYQQAVLNQQMCTSAGRIASLANGVKRSGMTKEDLLKEISGSPGINPLAIEEVYSRSMSDKEAYMSGWARCMDGNKY